MKGPLQFAEHREVCQAGFWFGLFVVFATIGLLCGCSPRVPVLVAAEQGDLEKVRVLLSQGHSVNERDPGGKFGWTPLMAALFHDHTNVAHYLIEAGADLNIRDREGETALMHAIANGDQDLEVVKDLIAHGADVNAKDRMVATVLSYASSDPPKPRVLEAVKAAMSQQEKTK